MKTLEITLEDALMLHKGLQEALDTEVKDFKLAYWIGRLHDKTSTLQKHFDKAQAALFKEYAEEGEKGQLVVPQENVAEFNEKLEELLAQKETLSAPTFRLSQFEQENLKPIFYRRVGMLIEDDLTEEAPVVRKTAPSRKRKKTA